MEMISALNSNSFNPKTQIQPFGLILQIRKLKGKRNSPMAMQLIRGRAPAGLESRQSCSIVGGLTYYAILLLLTILKHPSLCQSALIFVEHSLNFLTGREILLILQSPSQISVFSLCEPPWTSTMYIPLIITQIIVLWLNNIVILWDSVAQGWYISYLCSPGA